MTNIGAMMIHLKRYSKLLTLLFPLVVTACATGNTPEAKKLNARKDTQEALNQIYQQHPGAKSAVNRSKAHIVCTGNNSYLLAVASGGGVCVLDQAGQLSYYRYATGGLGAGIGWTKLGFVQAFMTNEALVRFKEAGFEGQAQAEASARFDGEGDQMHANQSADLTGVKTYQTNLMGAAVQATVQGYKYWPTNFEDDFIQNP